MTASNKLIERRKDILGGTPVFKGTRVPVSTFFEYLEAGHSVIEFLEDFPTVSKKQAVLMEELSTARKELDKGDGISQEDFFSQIRAKFSS